MKLLRLKKAVAVLISLILAAACFTGCGKSQSGGEGTTVAGKVKEIKLPETENSMVDFKIDDDGNILISKTEPVSKYKSIGRVWRTPDEGETWEKVYETSFETEPVGDKVTEVLIYFADEGWLIWNSESDYSNGYSYNLKRCYMRDADSVPEELDLSWTDAEKDDVSFFTKEKIYAFSL